MKRKIYSKLIEWKESPSHKPLILNGVRQCGKTYIMKEFGKNEFQTFAYVNCDRNENLHQIFEGGFNISKIIRGISALSGVDIIPGKTLIFLDEVQSFPLVLESLKYFCEDAPDYHVAVAGSLLGIALHSGVSFPVGKVQTMKLYPMDFEEFLMAKGEQQLLRIMHDHDFDLLTALHEKCKDLLRQYYYVGGMPEVVKSYIDNGQLKPVRAIQNEILSNYAGDFSKHAPYQEVPRISMVWQSILGQLSRENKKFIYGALKKGGRAKEFEVAIQWLVDAGLVYKVNRVRDLKVPLRFYSDSNAFKLYLLDIGLLGAMTDAPAESILIGDNIFSEYKGAFTENYVLQQIVTIPNRPTYYYSKDNSTQELDFVVQKDNIIYPIEVKAEENVKSKSLATCITHDFKGYNLHGIRFSMKGFKEQDWMTNIPLYAARAFVI